MIVATIDTGALIAIERQKARGMMLLRATREQRARLFTITPVIAEWWGGRTDVRDRLELAITIVPLPLAVAETAGVVLGHIRNSRERARLTVDVMVMAYAATVGGGLVYTSDVVDLSRLASYFPDVRVLSV